MDKLNNFEPPCKPDQILALSFTFDNLQKYLTFLTNNDKLLGQNIRDLQFKVQIMDEFKKQVDEMEYKIDNYFQKFLNIDQSLSAHQNKFQEIETKFFNINNKNDEMENKLKIIEEKTKHFEENIYSLTNKNEENFRNYFKMNEIIEKISTDNENMFNKIEVVNKNLISVNNILKENENKFIDVEDKIETNFFKTEKKISENKVFIEIVQKKTFDTDNMLMKLFDTVNEISGGSNPKYMKKTSITNIGGGIGNVISNAITGNNNNNNNLNLNVNQDLLKHSKEIDEFKKINKNFEEFLENLKLKDEDLQIQIKDLKEDLIKIKESEKEFEEGLQAEFLTETKNLEMITETNHYKEIGIHYDKNFNPEIINEKLQKMNDNVKIISQNLGRKAGREDLDKTNNTHKVDFDKLNEKITENFKSLENKIKILSGQGGSEIDGINPKTSSSKTLVNIESGGNKNLQEMIIKFSRDIIYKELSTPYLKKNDYMKEVQEKIDTQKTEIEKLNEYLSELRENLKQSTLENNLKENLLRVANIENTIIKMKIKLDDVIKNLDGENAVDENDKDNETNRDRDHGSLRDHIKNIAGNLKITGDRLERIANKQENMNSEILSKVKKDLNIESNRILDDFKTNLKGSISRIEDQLREKVDRFNLDEFGRKLDNKFDKEMNKKLDRNDLKKNTNLINRKIDTLENKISKTLVDTLIDLQMEEAPLMMKKSMNGEKCASCNQFLPHSHDKENEHKMVPYKTTGKFLSTFKPQDKYVSNHINESVIEESHKKGQLPDINSSKEMGKTGFRKRNYSDNNKLNLIKFDEEKNTTMIIHEELEKKYINPNEFMKNINKAHDLKMSSK